MSKDDKALVWKFSHQTSAEMKIQTFFGATIIFWIFMDFSRTVSVYY